MNKIVSFNEADNFIRSDASGADETNIDFVFIFLTASLHRGLMWVVMTFATGTSLVWSLSAFVLLLSRCSSAVQSSSEVRGARELLGKVPIIKQNTS